MLGSLPIACQITLIAGNKAICVRYWAATSEEFVYLTQSTSLQHLAMFQR